MCRLVTGASDCHTPSAVCTLCLSTLPGTLVCVQLSLQSRSPYGGRGTCLIFPWSPSYSSPQGTSGLETNAWSFSSEYIHVFLLPVQLCCIPRVLGRFTGNMAIAQTVKLSELDSGAISHPRTGPAITSFRLISRKPGCPIVLFDLPTSEMGNPRLKEER